MNENHDRENLYCNYCKDRIKENEPYIVDKDDNTYHSFCWELMHTYSDPFGDEDIDEE